jgi:hypothetical protein
MCTWKQSVPSTRDTHFLGSGCNGESNVVKAFISHLRKINCNMILLSTTLPLIGRFYLSFSTTVLYVSVIL